jgi:hypothetical protein
MSKKLFCLAAIAAILVLVAPVANAQVRGADCSYLVAGNTYSLGFEGLTDLGVLFKGQPLVPNAGAGFVTFHPRGKATGSASVSVGMIGVFTDMAIDNADYSLTWNAMNNPLVCTGSLLIHQLNYEGVLGKVDLHFQLVVGKDGREISFMHTDLPLMVNFRALPMETYCMNATISRTYSSDTKGWMFAGTPSIENLNGFAPFVFSGAFKFDAYTHGSESGSGTVQAWDTVVSGGTSWPRTMTGWYKINHNCTGWMQIADQQFSYRIEMFVLDGGNRVQILNQDAVPGTTVPMFLMEETLSSMGRF